MHITDRVIKIMSEAKTLQDFVDNYSPNIGESNETFYKGGAYKTPLSTQKVTLELTLYSEKTGKK